MSLIAIALLITLLSIGFLICLVRARNLTAPSELRRLEDAEQMAALKWQSSVAAASRNGHRAGRVHDPAGHASG